LAQKRIVTKRELDKLITHLTKRRSGDKRGGARLFEELCEWQPELFSWLKEKVEESSSADDIINAHLVALIAIHEKYKDVK